MNRVSLKVAIMISMVLSLYSCKQGQKAAEKKQEAIKPTIAVVNYPIYYFAQRIGGDNFQLEYPIPADVDPAYWVPDDEALTVYQSADIVLSNGADYAKWMNNVSLPASRIINTSLTVKEKYFRLENVTTHSHGPDGEHEHTGLAFTTWLDFEIALAQAEVVLQSLVSQLTDKQGELDQNFASLKNDLLSLHAQMLTVSAKIGDQHIIGSHPVYQYLAQAYGLKIHSVHFEPDEMPAEEQWKELDHLLEHYPIKIMLWEDEPLSEIKEILSRKGIEIKVFNPCGNRPDSGDFMELMNKNINTLQTMQSQNQQKS